MGACHRGSRQRRLECVGSRWKAVDHVATGGDLETRSETFNVC